MPALVALAFMLVAGKASASITGYVCTAEYVPAGYAPSLGSSGYVTTTVYSGPYCAGSYLGSGDFCSYGAANTTYCDGSMLYTDAGLQSLVSNLARAAGGGSKVSVWLNSYGTTGPWGSVTFYAQ
jgi:hypothetical protein